MVYREGWSMGSIQQLEEPPIPSGFKLIEEPPVPKGFSVKEQKLPPGFSVTRSNKDLLSETMPSGIESGITYALLSLLSPRSSSFLSGFTKPLRQISNISSG